MKRRASVRALATVAVFCLLATGCSSTDDRRVTADIDRPAVDKVVPPGVMIDVKRDFGASGDGATDDTNAIQAAISTGIGFAGTRKDLYFPAGVYLVSRPLTWQRADGTWSTWLTLQGENRDRTIIRLVSGASGFQDPATPQSVVVTGSQNPLSPDGSGGQAFHNFIFDLTVDVGVGNRGANGIDYLSNNRGSIRNVVVEAPIGSGNVGISMLRRYPGPAILQDVRVNGFSRGIALGQAEYSMVAEHLRLSGQRDVGVELRNNVFTIRDLISSNTVPAVRSGSPDAQGGLLTMLDSVLGGGEARSAAIENYGALLLRGVHTTGYGTGLREHGNDRRVDADTEISYPPGPGAGTTRLRLPIAEEPQVPEYALEDWAGADQFGAHVNDLHDDTAAIQAALDSGKPVVYLHPGRYVISRTLRVPATVRVIEGFDAWLLARFGAMVTGSPLFSVDESSAHPLIVTKLYFDVAPAATAVDRVADRVLFIRDCHMSGWPFRGRPGKLYLTDVEGGGSSSTWTFTTGQEVWARQFNVEQRGLKIFNDGGHLWVLGLKTELPSTVLRTANGARTELLGGLLYAVKPVDETVPAIESQGGTESLSFVTSAYQPQRNYRILVSRDEPSGREQLTEAQVPRRGSGSIVALYGAP